LPKSRKRKTRRGGSSSRGTYSKNKSNQTTKAIAFVVIALVALGTLFFIIFGGGRSSTPAPGVEVTTPSGLKYIDEVVGTGQSPRTGQTVTVHYTGTLENGTKFESSVDKGQPFPFRIGTGTVIPGWDEGVMTMKPGGKRKLIIPPDLAYGAQGRPGIPPNSKLIFEIELLSVK
jgi:peptidylprolyl isomerase